MPGHSAPRVAVVRDSSRNPPTKNYRSREIAPKPSKGSHSVPRLFQSSPRLKALYRPSTHANRSPTESRESRKRWAEKERAILDVNHRSHPLTHEAVAKFKRPASVEFLKLFQRRVRQSLAYWIKSRRQQFAVYFVLEIERNNCVHYHFLIRTAVRFPRDVLKPIIDKASNGLAVLQHCETVNDVQAITRYVVKDLSPENPKMKKLLLFKPDLGIGFCGSWNRYFIKPKEQLWADWKRERYGNSARPVDCRNRRPLHRRQ